jgi:pimeloyl-ACP methyl ester carboxylesterase
MGRHDRVMPLGTAQEASARYGWPLRMVDDAGHFLVADQPDAFPGGIAGRAGGPLRTTWYQAESKCLPG